MKYLIFDFDGVLGDTWDIRNAFISKNFGISITQAAKEGIAFFRYPHLKKGNLSPEEVIKTQAFLDSMVHDFLQKGYNLFDGFIDELRSIKDTRFAIASTASKRLFEDKIKATGLVFNPMLSFEDHHAKEEKVMYIANEWHVPLHDLYYFTDTLSDVLELQTVLDKKHIIGCSWGYHGYDILSELLPEDQILKQFSDIHTLFSS